MKTQWRPLFWLGFAVRNIVWSNGLRGRRLCRGLRLICISLFFLFALSPSVFNIHTCLMMLLTRAWMIQTFGLRCVRVLPVCRPRSTRSLPHSDCQQKDGRNDEATNRRFCLTRPFIGLLRPGNKWQIREPEHRQSKWFYTISRLAGHACCAYEIYDAY